MNEHFTHEECLTLLEIKEKSQDIINLVEGALLLKYSQFDGDLDNQKLWKKISGEIDHLIAIYWLRYQVYKAQQKGGNKNEQ